MLKKLVQRLRQPKARKPAKRKDYAEKKPLKGAGGPGKHWIPGMTPHDGYGVR